MLSSGIPTGAAGYAEGDLHCPARGRRQCEVGGQVAAECQVSFSCLGMSISLGSVVRTCDRAGPLFCMATLGQVILFLDTPTHLHCFM